MKQPLKIAGLVTRYLVPVISVDDLRHVCRMASLAGLPVRVVFPRWYATPYTLHDEIAPYTCDTDLTQHWYDIACHVDRHGLNDHDNNALEFDLSHYSTCDRIQSLLTSTIL